MTDDNSTAGITQLFFFTIQYYAICTMWWEEAAAMSAKGWILEFVCVCVNTNSLLQEKQQNRFTVLEISDVITRDRNLKSGPAGFAFFFSPADDKDC